MIILYIKSFLIIFSFIILFSIIYYLQLNGNYINYVRNNWKDYQCKPYIIPIAGLFRPKNCNKTFFQFTFENFKKCQWVQIKIFFGFFIKPIVYIIKIITKIIKKFTDTLDIFRKEAKSIRLMFKTIVESIAEKMENSYAAVQFYQAKMQNIIKHQIALFQLLMYFMDSLKLTLESLINGPLIDLVKFLPIYGIALLVLITICLLCIFGGLFTKMVACPICLICFSGDTKCILIDKTIKKIKEIKLGNELYQGGKVTSTFIFDISNKNSDIYDYNGIKVSGSHIVYENRKAIRIENSKYAKKINYNENYIYCVNTENRYINILSKDNNYLFSDFFECSNNKINHYHQKLIEYTLNNQNINKLSLDTEVSEYHNYEWGFGEDTLVKLSNGESKLISKINFGDILLDGGKVYGKVKHLANKCKLYKYKNNIISGTVLIQSNNLWTRTYSINYTKKISNYTNINIYHLVCDHHYFILDNGLKVRDYLEINEDHSIFNIIMKNNLNNINKSI